MSGPRALKAIDNVLTYRLGPVDAWRDSLVEARAALAELIDAGLALQEAMDEPDTGPFDTLTVKRFHEADARHREALARVGAA